LLLVYVNSKPDNLWLAGGADALLPQSKLVWRRRPGLNIYNTITAVEVPQRVVFVRKERAGAAELTTSERLERLESALLLPLNDKVTFSRTRPNNGSGTVLSKQGTTTMVAAQAAAAALLQDVSGVS
jgi:hypothetical protein